MPFLGSTLLKTSKTKLKDKFQISFFEILKSNLTTLHGVMDGKYQRNKLINSVHLNGQTSGFHPQTKIVRLTLHSIIYTTAGKYCSTVFIRMVTI